MIDTNLLKLLRTRADFNRVIDAVNMGAIDHKTRLIVKAVKKYYELHSSHQQIDFKAFIPFVERTYLSKFDPEDREVFILIMKNMAKNYPDEDSRSVIVQSLHELNLAHSLTSIVERYNDGDDIDVMDALRGAVDIYELALGSTDVQTIDENIDFFLDGVQEQHGLKWRLNCLNKSMIPLQGGHAGIIAARPDQGKTSFLASELTYFASQIPEDRCILWINNEGNGVKILPRLMQAALNCTVETLIKKKEAGTLYDEYYEAVGGKNRIRVVDAHGFTTGKVESVIQSNNPAVVVFDMIDNIRGFGHAARTDLALEMMYQWAREKAVKYDFVSLATSQISSDGKNEPYPGMAYLKDSQTGKQGACDFQLMIGSLEDDDTQRNLRWLSLPKNKIAQLKYKPLKEQVTFDKARARYNEAKSDD